MISKHLRRGEGQGLLPQVLEMLTFEIWHIGHYSVRSGLDTMTPNQVLGDVMTDDTYRDDDDKEEKKEKKDEKKDEK